MQVTQSEFRAALLDAAAPIPAGLIDSEGTPAGRRYGVYRNNITVSLIEAMKVAFPLVRDLLGQQNFDSLVPNYVRAHPPESPLMMHYGAGFPEFLEELQPLAHLGYLSDVARLDLAMRVAYHAADARPFDPTVLQQTPETLASIHLPLAPATHVFRSRWPIFDLWRRAMQPDAPQPRAIGQAILITRPEFDPQIHLLPTGAATWLHALKSHPIGPAIEIATAAAPEFNFAETLSLALQTHAFTTTESNT